jgi:hypothetical protein
VKRVPYKHFHRSAACPTDVPGGVVDLVAVGPEVVLP